MTEDLIPYVHIYFNEKNHLHAKVSMENPIANKLFSFAYFRFVVITFLNRRYI